MALPASGELSMGMVNVELGANFDSPLNLNHPEVRLMALKPTPGTQISFADLRGKAYFDYDVFQQSVINSGWAGTRRWVNSKGFRIVVKSPPGLTITQVMAQDANGAILWRYPFRYTQSTDDWNILVKPSIVWEADRIDTSCIENQANVVSIAPYAKSGNWRTVTIHKLFIGMSNGEMYELRNHRNFTFGYPQVPDKAFSQDEFFRQDGYTGIQVPPNN